MPASGSSVVDEHGDLPLRSGCDQGGAHRGRTEDEPATKPKPKRAATTTARLKYTLYLRADLVEQARGVVLTAQLQGAGPVTLSALFDRALERELLALVDELKPEGGEFPRVPTALPGGRTRGA